jgi:cation:H+ antiporter
MVLATFLAIALGAKTVVDSAGSLAERFGVSELVIGLTLVAFGTSAPEFGVTTMAALEGRSAISVGNIVGSNIFNLGFILGGAALVKAIPTDRDLVWRDGVVLVGSTFLIVLLIGRDLTLSHLDGWTLLAMLGLYLVVLWKGRHNGVGGAKPVAVPTRTRHRAVWGEVGLLLLGFGVIGLSSHVLIVSASALARGFGVSEWVIAVTIVAAGTSVPEMATTLAGVVRGRAAMSAGNIIGSDIFNQLGVLGLAGTLHTMHLEPAARASLAALAGMAVLVLIMMRSGWRLSRFEGLLLVLVALLRWGLDFATRF